MNSLSMSSELYDFVKRLVRIILPAFSALYFGLASIWNLPAAEQVVGTIAVVTTFLGVCLGISNNNFEGDGTIITSVNEDSGKTMYTLDINTDLDKLSTKKQLVLKVAA